MFLSSKPLAQEANKTCKRCGGRILFDAYKRPFCINCGEPRTKPLKTRHAYNDQPRWTGVEFPEEELVKC